MTHQAFDLRSCELSGSTLLEAGAGTGKTYSLAFLYLRLIVQEGLSVEDIVVTTFTNAATAELKARLFATVQEAERCLEYLRAEDAVEDDLLSAVLTDARQHCDDDTLASRLRLACAQFDHANIFTIDGFALQLLREHADVLNTYAPEDILANDNEYVQQAYTEVARDNFSVMGCAAERVGRAVASFSGEQICSLIAGVIQHRDAIDLYAQKITEEAQSALKLLETLRQGDYQSALAMVSDGIEADILSKQSYKMQVFERHAQRVCDTDDGLDAQVFKFFSRKQLCAKVKKGKHAEFENPFFYACDELCEVADSLYTAAQLDDYHIVIELADVLAPLVEQYKAEQMAMTYHDIMQVVSAGAGRINTPFQAALIDESQDTNSEQMLLFKRLFLRDAQNITVFFVGDPKQAIYGFRGANIYSYLDIADIVDHHFVMDTNYRSTQAVNETVNTLFSGTLPFIDQRLRYHAIGWDKANETSPCAGNAMSVVDTGGSDRTDYAAAAAHALVRTMNDYGFKPRDLAVLVRTTKEAKIMQQALSDVGLANSFTGKVSLYESDEATWMLTLLQSIYRGDTRLVKSLMLTPLFGYCCDDVHKSDLVNHLRSQLQECHTVYQRQGLGVMFYRVMQRFGIVARLLERPGGKRSVTNWIQVFEILQHRLQEKSLSLAGLCDFLSGHIQRQDSEAELRLEDADAVSVMTIHTSKGLEFPVVCLPFFDYPIRSRPMQSHELLVSHQYNHAAPSFIKPKGLMKDVSDEEESEARRLAYVALTRSKYHTVIVRGESAGSSKKKTMLKALLETLPDPAVLTASDAVREYEATDEALFYSDDEKHIYSAKQLDTQLYSRWYLESFSRLQQQAAPYVATHRPVSSDEVLAESEHSVLLDYPAGANPGSALHEMYEHLMEHRVSGQALYDAIERSVHKYLSIAEQQRMPDTQALADAIEQTTRVVLTPQTFALADVLPTQQSIEMKFFMHLRAKARHHLLARFGLHHRDERIIPTDGYVHGYIDYCCEYQGKFYVIDYKSNRLGDVASAYDNEAMEQEMQHHRYDLQALIYTVALCKHLHIRDEKNYRDTIGGYFYLFVRGMRVGQSTGIYANHIEWQVIQELLDIVE